MEFMGKDYVPRMEMEAKENAFFVVGTAVFWATRRRVVLSCTF